MPIEVGLWRVDGGKPEKIQPTGVPLESQLEAMIEADPAILGTPLLLIGRQVPTDFGKFIDLLAVDDEGSLHVLELKRDRTPREVVAQLLDYGSWVRTLTHDAVLELYGQYKAGEALEQAWTDTFGGDPPEELNGAHRLTIVASDVDAATERIVDYLAAFDVPVNVVFFRYFNDGGHSYLARTWLIDETRAAARSGDTKTRGGKETWNQHDWYISFGEDSDHRRWEDAQKYGFISAGGARWFSGTLLKLPVGARVFACIPKLGYVGVGTTTGRAMPFDDAIVNVNGESTRIADLALTGRYVHNDRGPDEDVAEYFVPVDWEKTVPREQAVWEKGMFANQNSACKLRNRFTLERLATAFGVEVV
jgi:hypothetical protein